jgi:hypothetical protein
MEGARGKRAGSVEVEVEVEVEGEVGGLAAGAWSARKSTQRLRFSSPVVHRPPSLG